MAKPIGALLSHFVRLRSISSRITSGPGTRLVEVLSLSIVLSGVLDEWGPHLGDGFGAVDDLIAGCRFFLNRGGDLCNLFGVLFATFCVLMLTSWRKVSMLDLCKTVEFYRISVNRHLQLCSCTGLDICRAHTFFSNDMALVSMYVLMSFSIKTHSVVL